MSKNIKIMIQGEPGAGKTTLALLIKRILEHHGFTDVTMSDIDADHDIQHEHLQAMRVGAIKGRHVDIITANVTVKPGS